MSDFAAQGGWALAIGVISFVVGFITAVDSVRRVRETEKTEAKERGWLLIDDEIFVRDDDDRQ